MAPTKDSNYRQLVDKAKEFLNNFVAAESLDETYDDHHQQVYKYKELIQAVVNRQKKLIVIHLDDVKAHGSSNEDSNSPSATQTRRSASAITPNPIPPSTNILLEEVLNNTVRMKELFSEAIDDIISGMQPSIPILQQDSLDILIQHRINREHENRVDDLDRLNQPVDNNNNNNPNDPVAPPNQPNFRVPDVNRPFANNDPHNIIPIALTRRYELVFAPLSVTDKKSIMRLREVNAKCMGKLVTLSGIVTRVSEVKPRLTVAVYECGLCGLEIYQTVKKSQYMPALKCPNTGCANSRNGGDQPVMVIVNSKFVKFQEIKLQELSNDVPIGSIPRSLTLHLTGEVARSCTAGDMLKVSGICLPVPYTGYKAMKMGRLNDTYLDVMTIEKYKKQYSEYFVDSVNSNQINDIVTADPYTLLSKSIAPEIFGHDDVKKALLLQLVGNPQRNLDDGMSLRGDIHVCLMGDPGVAKSQLLKYITKIAPRGIYTTGKGSSGVGLTAAVLRDQLSGELTLEGGALVLADMGIACIDEFDKMNEIDRTAIHEVMEQQTISIAKGGITTTLNARAAILAAANPAFGHYNRKKSPAENINLPAALLSRFDLMFLLLDKITEDNDRSLAKHITHVHRTGSHPPLHFDPIEPAVVREYIARARRLPNPNIASDGPLADYIVQNYTAMRAEEIESGSEAQGYTTIRTLMSILRLSRSIARLKFKEEVDQSDIDEAIRLMKSSKASLNDDEQEDLDSRRTRMDPKGAIYAIIREYTSEDNEVDISQVEASVIAKGFSRAQMIETLEEYEDLGIWVVDWGQQKITFAA